MTQPIDRAFVEIVPDTRDFTKDLDADVKVAYAKLQRQTDKVTTKVSQSFDEAGRKIERTFTTIEKDGELTVKVIEKAFNDAGERITRAFSKSADKAAVSQEFIAEVARLSADTAADAFERAGERIEDAFREASRVAAIQEAEIARQARQANEAMSKNTGLLDRAFKGLFETVVSLGSALVGLGAAAPTPAGLIAILATVTAIGAAIGPVIALVGALADLVGLIGPLPAALGVLVAAVLPLVFAFQGLGDAIKAVNDGDPEKIAEAMKKLSPAARSVVKEITGLNGVFDKFRKSIQQSFFAPIVGDIGSTVRLLISGLQPAINSVADALGHIAENFLAFLQQTSTIKTLNALFTATSTILNTLNVPLVNLFDTLFSLTGAGLPFIQRFADAFAGLLDKFNEFVATSLKTGAFNKFVEDAIKTTKELFKLVGAVGNLFGALFSNADDEGRDFIAVLTEMINHLAEFLRTAEGQEALQNLVDTAKQVGAALLVLGRVLEFVFKAINFMKDAIVGEIAALTAFVNGVKAVAGAIGRFLGDAVDIIGGWISAIGDFFGQVGDFFGNALDAVESWIDSVIEFFTSLPGKIITEVKKIPGQLIAFFNTALDAVLHDIGVKIGLILFAFTVLPGKIIEAVKALPGQIAAIFDDLWNFARDSTVRGGTSIVESVVSVITQVKNFFIGLWNDARTATINGIAAVITFVQALPGRISSFLSSIGPIIANIFRDALASAKAFVVNGFNAIVTFVKGVPNRIRDAFKAAGGFVSDIGGAIAGAIKSFLNRAIDRINGGIASIDNVLPGSLPRIPRLAKGGVINPTPGGTLAVLGEAGDREIATPEKLLRSILAEQSPGIVFGPGSVVVEFSGVVPTEGDAFRTGTTVAQGILATLEKRNIRTTVRAL